MKRNVLIVFCISLLLMITAPMHAQDDDTQTLTVGDDVREYHIYVPESYEAGTPVPLMLALHGGGGSGREFSVFSGFSDVADDSGFIVVYPSGVEGRWNFLSRENRADDIAFLTTLIDDIATSYTVDMTRVYVTGFSNGGLMALRLRCSFADRFAGVAVVGATMTFSLAEYCLETSPLPTMLVWGTNDGAFPWEGYAQAGADEVISTLSSTQTQTLFASLNGCELAVGAFEDITAEGSEASVFRQSFQTCTDDAFFNLIGIVDLDNRLPSPSTLLTTNSGIQNIRVAIWEFLSQHTLTTN